MNKGRFRFNFVIAVNTRLGNGNVYIIIEIKWTME